ncbi:hypothetical protein F3Y22_tig00116951pilonHSYRG00930 [Hibiscus syriacus]|uniref:Bifunctional inhibitor/plant lipid transfer protein/seed storage helical domain-containing protein n=2 Tax=Hibiscus syriacus TaxID=106335 RepID=A0A6A2Y0C0_HIBSY|nr:hypothetical protein F3Y22_tig00116951pilonHSYRG00930 [Hibiscus syriacus]
MLVCLITSDVMEPSAAYPANRNLPGGRALLEEADIPDETRFSCLDVATLLSPCWSFLKAGGSPTSECCIGAENIADLTNSKQDERKLCDCLKGELPKIGPYDPNRLPLLEQKCDIEFYIPPITATTDCSK